MRVKIDYPVLNVKLVPLKKIEANDYNPYQFLMVY